MLTEKINKQRKQCKYCLDLYIFTFFGLLNVELCFLFFLKGKLTKFQNLMRFVSLASKQVPLSFNRRPPISAGSEGVEINQRRVAGRARQRKYGSSIKLINKQVNEDLKKLRMKKTSIINRKTGRLSLSSSHQTRRSRIWRSPA